MALWDTGATASVISTNVVEKLKLLPTGIIEAHSNYNKNKKTINGC